MAVPGSDAIGGPPRPDRALLDDLRVDLVAAAYTVAGIEDCLGPTAHAALNREQPVAARLRTEGRRDPCAVLLRVFGLGLPVPAGDLARALPALGVAGARELGLVEESGGSVRATCHLHPYADDTRDRWLASDLEPQVSGRAMAADHVIGVGPASWTLAGWTPRPSVGRALDLGTGCAVQALHLRDHATHVVGTDLSPRALGFARFNAELAGVDLDLRQGHLADPVVGERFDLVVCNPPFVITPPGVTAPRHVYRDGTLRGRLVSADGFMAAVVAAIDEILAPGGLAQIVGNWVITRDSDLLGSWPDWLDGRGLDAWVVRRDVVDGAQYAETWLSDEGVHPGDPGHEDRYREWLTGFEDAGISTIAVGIVTLHRPPTDRPTWLHGAHLAGPVAQPMGPAVLATMRARAWLADHGDPGILATRWRCPEQVVVQATALPGVIDEATRALVRRDGWRPSFVLDEVSAAFVGVADGELTAGQALAAIAAVLGRDTSAVRDEALPVLREMIADGVLVRAD